MKKILSAIIVLALILTLTISAHAKCVYEWNEDLQVWEFTVYDDDDDIGPFPTRVEDAGPEFIPVPVIEEPVIEISDCGLK